MRQSKILLVASYTFKEIWKSKILLNVFFIGVALVLITYVATEFTYGVPERVALDFGLGMLSISAMCVSLFLGVTLLAKEIDSRTVYMVISRPVSRAEFIFGKILGLMSIQLLNVILLSIMTILSTLVLGGRLDQLIFWTLGFTYLESFLLLLVVVFVSLFANTILSVLFASVVYLLGHAVKETQNVSMVERTPLLHWILEGYHFILPGFYKLNLKDYVLYDAHLPSTYLVGNLLYGVTYSSALLLLIVFIFNRKNID